MDSKQLIAEFESRVVQLIDLLGFAAEVQVETLEVDDRHYLDVKVTVEQGSAELIGHHGRNLDSLTTVLTMLVPESDQRYGVLLDINGYRAERTKYIEDMAAQTIDQALNTNQPVEMVAMKPWERRVVHMVASNRTDIVTESVGEEPDRRVLIRPS